LYIIKGKLLQPFHFFLEVGKIFEVANNKLCI